jgi:hypothetical protein
MATTLVERGYTSHYCSMHAYAGEKTTFFFGFSKVMALDHMMVRAALRDSLRHSFCILVQGDVFHIIRR